MKKLLILLLAVSNLTCFAESVDLPKCTEEYTLTPEEIAKNESERFKNAANSRDYISQMTFRYQDKEKILKNIRKEDLNYKILDYSEPFYVDSAQKTSMNPIGGCMARRSYMVIDYVLELENGDICEDTLVRFNHHKDKTFDANCIATTALLSPAIVIGYPFMRLYKAAEIDGSFCGSEKCINKNFVLKFFENNKVSEEYLDLNY